MLDNYNPTYPSMDDIINKARKRVPRFAIEYLEGGCNEDINLKKNSSDIQKIELQPHYLRPESKVSLSTELFDETYSAPFGIAPIGLQGLIWPGSAEILAKAAFNHNIPFILSTVTTASIEKISEITEGKFWFQLYHPAENKLRDDIIDRLQNCGCKVLVILADVPVFGFRPRDIRNGLALPPRITLPNILQVMGRPIWGLSTLKHGIPEFSTMKKYMPKNLNIKQLGVYMNQTFSGKLTTEKISAIRKKWQGKLILKGVVNDEDAKLAKSLGIDGFIVSNHGGRQIDAGESSINSFSKLAPTYKNHLPLMIDSGISSGVDIARCMASGVDFTFLGRSFMFSVGALGSDGGEHAIYMLKAQLQQVLEQVGCQTPNQLPNFLMN